MYTFYNLALIFLSILLSPIILTAFLIKPKFRAGFRQKVGFYKKLNNGKQSIWFHAVSVGEVNAVEALIKRAKQEFPEFNIVITTVTKTGQQVANSKLKGTADLITYFPYDITFCVNRAIKAFDPKIIVIAETEIWPSFCNRANKKNIPIVLVNGRISPNSYKGYKKLKFFFEKVLSNFSLLLMQSNEDKERIIKIGASPDKTEVMGNLKFDINNLMDISEIKNLKQSLKINDCKVIIAGSTHKDEDEIIINAYKMLKAEFDNLKLMIAPRHPERNDNVLKLICQTGLRCGLRSKHSNFKDSDIILLDTMGELSKLYSVADIAFIGGSFSGTGGHNPLEPALYGVPVISGFTVYNFKDIYKYMSDTSAATIVNTQCELFSKIRELLNNKEKYSEASKSCIDIFDKNKGALDYAINSLKTYID